jgi:hypothetical protein
MVLATPTLLLTCSCETHQEPSEGPPIVKILDTLKLVNISACGHRWVMDAGRTDQKMTGGGRLRLHKWGVIRALPLQFRRGLAGHGEPGL